MGSFVGGIYFGVWSVHWRKMGLDRGSGVLWLSSIVRNPTCLSVYNCASGAKGLLEVFQFLNSGQRSSRASFSQTIPSRASPFRRWLAWLA